MASALAVQVALTALGAAACADVDSLAPSAGGTTSQAGAAGHGGSTGGAATGGDSTSAGGTSAGGTSAGGTSAGGTGGAVAQMVPDFSLVDVNPSSMSSGQPVSPRDYLLRVSAWYFGHST